MKIKEIKAAIMQLSREELDQIVGWLGEHYGKMWNEEEALELEINEIKALFADIDVKERIMNSD